MKKAFMDSTSTPKSLINRLGDIIISPHAAIPAASLRDVRLVTSIALTTAVFVFIGVLFSFDTTMMLGLAAAIVAYALSRTAYWKIAGLIIVVLLAAPSLVNLATLVPEPNIDLGDWVLARAAWLALPMMLANVFFSWRGTFLYGLTMFVAVILTAFYNPAIAPTDIIGSISLIGILTVLQVLAVRHRDLVEHDRQAELVATNQALIEARDTLELRVQERTAELHQLNATLEKRIEERVQELQMSQAELGTAHQALQHEKDRVKSMYVTIDILLKQLRSVIHHRPSREDLASYMTVLESEYEKLSHYFEN
jgi:hypothetical protein